MASSGYSMLSRAQHWLFHRTGFWRGRFYGRPLKDGRIQYDDFTRVPPGRGWEDGE